jgi:tetratricopeptide (TPR) repeat protein
VKLARALLVAWVTAGAAAARAEPDERPWAAGVPEARQVEARRLYDSGNLLFEQEKYTQALAIYRDAVALWDHPAIRYNMAVALIHLDQPLAAYESLAGALRYGAAPLQAEVYAQALTYKKLLLGQLAQLKVVCTEPGTQVFLDGEHVFTGPGEETRILAPGKHQLVASKPLFITVTRAVTLVAGGTVAEVLQPVAMPQNVHTERRWAPWKPWTVVAGGAVLALAGIPLQLAARSNMDRYERQVAEACPTGCPRDAIPEAARSTESRAHLENGLAIGLFAAGGAAVAAGVVLVLLNQPHPVEPASLTVVPAAIDGRLGAVVAGRF